MKKSALSGQRKSQLIFALVMMALPLLQFLVFTVYVNINTFVLAFQSEIDGKTVFGLKDNFELLLINMGASDYWKKTIWNSIGYIPVSLLITLPLSLFSAYFISKKIAGSKFFTVILYLPNIIPIVVMALVFKNIVNKDNGIITNILINLFGKDPTTIPNFLGDEKYAMGTLYFYAVWAGVGGNIVLLFGAISRIPDSVQEAAALDGCGPFREIFQIYVPLIWPTIATFIMFGFSVCFNMFLHTDVITRGFAGTHTIAYIVVSKLKYAGFINYNYIAFISLIICFISVPIVQGAKKLADKVFDTVEF